MTSLLKQLYLLWLFLLPTQLAYHYFHQFSYIAGYKIDYYSFQIYALDLLLVLIFVGSLFAKDFFKDFQNFISKFSSSLKFFSLLFIFNISFSSQPILTLQSIPTLLFLLINYITALFYLKKLNSPTIFGIFLLQITLLCLHAVYQFQTNHSLNSLAYWLGERPISISQQGIAKQTIFNQYKIRPYSTFSHPNSFAGYTLLVFWISFFINKNLKSKNRLAVFTILLITTGIVLLLTNSQAALLASIISLFSLVIPFPSLLLSAALLIFTPIIYKFINLPFFEYLFRQQQFSLLTKAFSTYWFSGTGISASLSTYSQFLNPNQQFMQPIHNLFYFILLETGILPLLFLIYKNFSIVRKSVKFTPIFITIIITGTFDHYWTTLHQNQHLLVFTLAFINHLNSCQIPEKT